MEIVHVLHVFMILPMILLNVKLILLDIALMRLATVMCVAMTTKVAVGGCTRIYINNASYSSKKTSCSLLRSSISMCSIWHYWQWECWRW